MIALIVNYNSSYSEYFCKVIALCRESAIERYLVTVPKKVDQPFELTVVSKIVSGHEYLFICCVLQSTQSGIEVSTDNYFSIMLIYWRI